MISVIDMKEALQSLNEDSNKHINLLHNIYTQATEIKEKLQQAADNGYIKGFIYFPTQRFIDKE